jgi:DNA-binding transcriptional ArsR family regulator
METLTAAHLFSALAQKARLDILRLLVASENQTLPAGEIGLRLKLPPATLSFHLSQLTHAGLIVAQRKSRSIFYAPNFKQVHDLIAFLNNNCCALQSTAPINEEKPRLKLKLND